MQNDMLSHYLAQVKYVTCADVNLVIHLEAVSASPVCEARLGMQFLFDTEMHMLTVLIQTPHAHQHHVCGTLASHGYPPTRVRKDEGSRHQSGLAVRQHMLDAITLAGADRLL